ncbi:SPFH domain-containing protein [Blastococcus capsensis]|uniref:SPFH domain-containing protein n=1 Tax=Blastococcus capsensis TaxID=1564163 RepID=UPI002541B105|nr:SPFH domain-containing protein [Blastococcus capsensis]MDK3255876.1 SPFH domain-containing protein [Blastococcus capsensis]
MQIVVQEWERVLLYRDGRFEAILGAGRHRRVRWRRRRVRVLIRPRLLVVPSQEVLTADGLSVKVSLTVAVRTADPRRWYEAVEDADGFVYAGLQIALREAVGARTLDELLAARGALPDDLRSLVGGSAEAVGVAIDSLSLRDVMVPAELRRAAAEVATARAQGQAALERARSEVAATRALANAARMVAEQPALLQLRTLQAVAAGGATVVLTNGPAGVEPIGTGRRDG